MNILVLYHTRVYSIRASQRDHLFSFKNHAKGCHVYYVNTFLRSIPKYFQKIKFDLIVFSWSYLGSRFDIELYIKDFKKIEFLKNIKCTKIALPQDEFSNTELLCRTINDFGIDKVYSVSPESEWKKIYKTVNFEKVTFSRVLTGYIEERLIDRILEFSKKISKRDIDVGYRSGSASYWGRFNLIKFRIAENFLLGANRFGYSFDIKFGWNNFLMGDDWYKFLLRCRFIPGVEGGSSIIDFDGSIYKNVKNYLKIKPNANYDEIEAACIPSGKDGEINVVALSPRHLEACLTKTCQILIEGDYNDILIPGRHYIELKKDFSNLDFVLQSIPDESQRLNLVETAYSDIILSGKYTYRSFIDFILNDNLDSNFVLKEFIPNPIFYFYNNIVDKFNWIFIFFFSLLRNFRDFVYLYLKK